MNSENSQIENNSISIMEILTIIAKQIRIIIVLPLLFSFIAIINVQYFSTPIYVSTSKITSSGSNGSGHFGASGLAAQFGITLPSSQSEKNWVYPEIIKSSIIAKRVLARKFSTKKYGDNKILSQILAPGNSDARKEQSEYFALKSFSSMVNVSEELKTGIITLSVSTFEPFLSYQINNALLDEIDDHQRNYNSLMADKTRKFIEERIIETEKELNLAEEKLKNFRDRNRRIQNSPGLLLDEQRLSREVAVLTGVFTTLKQQLETTKIEQVRDSDYVIIIDPPNNPLFYDKPRKRIYVIFAGIFGIGFGIILAFLKHFIDTTIAKDRGNFNTLKNLIFNNLRSLIPFISKDDE